LEKKQEQEGKIPERARKEKGKKHIYVWRIYHLYDKYEKRRERQKKK